MAVYGSELARVVLRWGPSGTQPWASEQAVCSFHIEHVHFTGNVFDWPAAVDYAAGKLVEKLTSHWSTLGTHMSIRAELNQVKVAQIDAGGHTVSEGVRDITDSSLRGNATGNMLPPEVACCISGWGYEPGTFAALKGRKRSRFYLPYLSTNLADGAGKVDHTAAADLLSAWQSFLNDVEGMHTSDALGTPADYWRFVAASGVDGEKTQIGWISVDDHFDSQRRRQHQDVPVRFVDTITHA